jgi:tetratricopeptide (TPR) repeat protein
MRVYNLERKSHRGKAMISEAHRFSSLHSFGRAKCGLCSGQAYVLCFVALFCAALFVGCQEEVKSSKSGTPPKVDKIDKTPIAANEKKKTQLLKELDSKFENPEAHYQLGRIYQEDGLLNQAEYRYSVALGFQPSHKEAQAALVKVMIDSGNKEKAGNYAEFFMNQADISAVDSFKLAEEFKKQGLDEFALGCYQQALRLAPNSAKINRQIGYYYLSKGERDRARDYLSRSFALNPNQPEVAGELGRLGVEVKIPRSTVKNTQKLDAIAEPASKGIEK